jgi:hypothetical protein
LVADLLNSSDSEIEIQESTEIDAVSKLFTYFDGKFLLDLLAVGDCSKH